MFDKLVKDGFKSENLDEQLFETALSFKKCMVLQTLPDFFTRNAFGASISTFLHSELSNLDSWKCKAHQKWASVLNIL